MKDTVEVMVARSRAGYRPPEKVQYCCKNCGAVGYSPNVFRKMAANRGAGGGIALIFARTDTSAWQELIFPFAVGVLFLRGRLRFYRVSPDGRAVTGQTATAPSALVAYSEYDFGRLRKCGLEGSLVRLRTNGPFEIHYLH